MNTKLKRVVEVPVTPAESMTDYLVDHINAIMICCGIQSIETRKYTSGFGSRLHVTMTPFPDAPSEIVTQGLVVKDAIAQLLAVVNLSKQSLSDFKEDEMANIHAMWSQGVEASKHPRDAKQSTQSATEAQTPSTSDEPDDGIPLDLGTVETDSATRPATQGDREEEK